MGGFGKLVRETTLRLGASEGASVALGELGGGAIALAIPVFQSWGEYERGDYYDAGKHAVGGIGAAASD